MGFRHATLRQRLFHGLHHAAADPKHGHWHEYAMEAGFVLSNIMFVVGSVCFFEGYEEWVYYFGDWMFIIAAFTQFLLTSYTLSEQIVARKHKTARFNQRDRQEVLETTLFVISSFIFFVGSVFFMPAIYKSKHVETMGHECGAWCFIVGSLGICVASYYNALGLATDWAKQDGNDPTELIIYNLNCWALGLLQIGGVCFVSGSFLYRPVFMSRCRTQVPEFAAGDNAMNNGTMLYLVGSLIFLVQSVLMVICGIIKHDKVEASSDEEKPLAPRGSDASRKGNRSTLRSTQSSAAL